VKILIAGDWHSEVHEEVISKALQSLGHIVEEFKWSKYFSAKASGISGIAQWLWLRIQNKYLFGPQVKKVNNELIKVSLLINPDSIFIYRGSHIFPSTIKKLTLLHPKAAIIGYNNDDPFSPSYPWWIWRHFKRAVPFYDMVMAYRISNIKELLDVGAKSALLWRSWFDAKVHAKPNLTIQDSEIYGCQVIFVGHYENDGRLEALDKLAGAGVKVKIFGPYKNMGSSGWYSQLERSSNLKHLAPTHYLKTAEYVKAISSADIALCFLSKLNRDTYTRRCFEIPAIGTALFSEYSSDLASLFLEGQEVEFFRNNEELVRKVIEYLGNKEKLKLLALNGHQRVLDDSHDSLGRAKELEKNIVEIKNNKS
jgi:spore maturation protein CgeB